MWHQNRSRSHVRAYVPVVPTTNDGSRCATIKQCLDGFLNNLHILSATLCDYFSGAAPKSHKIQSHFKFSNSMCQNNSTRSIMVTKAKKHTSNSLWISIGMHPYEWHPFPSLQRPLKHFPCSTNTLAWCEIGWENELTHNFLRKTIVWTQILLLYPSSPCPCHFWPWTPPQALLGYLLEDYSA